MTRKLSTMVIATALSCAAFAGTALAVAPEVDKAIKAFETVSADPKGVEKVCDLMKTMDEAGVAAESGEDTSKIDEIEATIKTKVDAIGPDFAAAWALQESMDPESDDAGAYSEAFGKLVDKCQPPT